ncbi:ATP-binding cassette subfamily B protein [Methylopila capsulata]|uniref:ATP-binding cassette subfamily B protein n=1 Tax=Methylopila capsulata TaxID=61654 RepID=A0A9W6MQP2_9HYPH|nr:glucan ABC transporter ATP-binding protein/ permease [Methylopila capsulata]MBM7851167.1 ATP-binding cassette subfamily B protein [Methylopila capsulata]GLK54224.1 beta-(1-->2)glucan export ATP-binding/permease protein NdvA [Methylopila capsulata]
MSVPSAADRPAPGIFATYVRAIGLLGPERPLALMLALGNVALALAAFAEPVLFGKVIDKLTRGEADAIPALAAAWGAVALAAIVGRVLVGLHADRLSHRRRLAAMTEAFGHVLTLPLSFHRRTHSGRIVKALTMGANALADVWLSFFRSGLATLVGVVALLPASLALNLWLGLILIGLVVVFGIALIALLRKTQTQQENIEGYHSDLAQHAADAIGNVAVVQSFASVGREMAVVRGVMQRLLDAQMPILSWWAYAAAATPAAGTLTVLGVVLAGAALNAQGLASVGDIVTFAALATLVVARLGDAVALVNMALLNAPRIGEFLRLLDAVPEVADRPDARDPGRVRGEVTFDRVSFAYEAGRPTLAEVSFEATPGMTVALVGATGSGKSTTLSLLHRAFDPQEGRVLIDGIDIRDMTLEGLRRNIGVVFQEPMLFARSIADNLRVGRPEATDAELEAACARAEVLDVVRRLPHGFATVLGERGASLSGGERQRLSIARALLKDPPILVLDEATSALDAHTEQKVQAALDAARAGRTTLVIAHRLATVRSADRVLVFERGRIVESGSFARLAAADGPFAKLVAAQALAHAADEKDPAPQLG